MRKMLAALLCTLAAQAHAVGRFTDTTDLWWNPNESGWGVNVIQQNEVLFLTFFVYSASRNPVWYSASDVRFAGDSSGAQVYTGDLFETHGPFYADFFNPASVTYRKVGTVIFRVTSIGTATLVYDIDGRTIQKQLIRYTARINEFATRYFGAVIGTQSECATPTLNGAVEEAGVQINITQTATNLDFRITGGTRTCTFGGPYTQSGRMGSMSGGYFCTEGVNGTFEATEMEVNPQGFSARLSTRTNICRFTGRIGGVRRD